ncbi:DUF2147 domain-containing protein [Polaribacter sp. KT 15]|uniref:DUF2147 domain-containing protein n=1 Tax=Polaribacter sp. KT 15 TaxID=1896175 RepID=UPI000909786B|nr:DUF2147 domain-containing protein [Polaribacter sp. KT 15]SHM68777.1 Uncharacterized conserved protein, DUF2147 family [Polaribacter sp. KT 15]
MKKTFFTFLFLSLVLSINSQTIFGKWNSKNETGTVDSVLEVYEKNGKAYAKVVEILNPARKNALCVDCEGEYKDKPILGLDILSGLEKDDDEWSGGQIIDPRNGKTYKCYIKLVNANKLKLRGYIGVSLFGKTAYWERAK